MFRDWHQPLNFSGREGSWTWDRSLESLESRRTNFNALLLADRDTSESSGLLTLNINR
jgi:hypothetical protein